MGTMLHQQNNIKKEIPDKIVMLYDFYHIRDEADEYHHTLHNTVHLTCNCFGITHISSEPQSHTALCVVRSENQVIGYRVVTQW